MRILLVNYLTNNPKANESVSTLVCQDAPASMFFINDGNNPETGSYLKSILKNSKVGAVDDHKIYMGYINGRSTYLLETSKRLGAATSFNIAASVTQENVDAYGFSVSNYLFNLGYCSRHVNEMVRCGKSAAYIYCDDTKHKRSFNPYFLSINDEVGDNCFVEKEFLFKAGGFTENSGVALFYLLAYRILNSNVLAIHIPEKLAEKV